MGNTVYPVYIYIIMLATVGQVMTVPVGHTVYQHHQNYIVLFCENSKGLYEGKLYPLHSPSMIVIWCVMMGEATSEVYIVLEYYGHGHQTVNSVTNNLLLYHHQQYCHHKHHTR